MDSETNIHDLPLGESLWITCGEYREFLWDSEILTLIR
jgi:hypothetical protein